MTNYKEHPIVLPPGLVEKWRDEALDSFPDDEYPCPCDIDDVRDKYIAVQAARWGADQELEACCEWVDTPAEYDEICAPGEESERLRAVRRPKPPSLKQQALQQLQAMEQAGALDCNIDAIREAIESLPDADS